MSSNEARQKAPKGSIKAARERAQAGFARPEDPQISRPVQVPQWPLNGNSPNSPKSFGSPTNPSSRNKTPPNGATRSPPGNMNGSSGNTPPRPKRPSEVPSILDGSKVQDPTPNFTSKAQEHRPQAQQHEPERYWEEDNVLLSPNEPDTPGTGLSGGSRPSTTSSFGSIPDFPVPDVPAVPSSRQQQPVQGPPRRSLGPPPTSRRGNSSYYSNNSYVVPIPEEGDGHQKTHESYASSQAFPKSWVDGPPEYYMTAYDEEDEDENGSWRPTNADDGNGPVRKASVGRQFKPSLTTVRSNSNSSGSSDGKPAEQQKPVGMGRAGAIATAAAAADLLPTSAYAKGQDSRSPRQLTPGQGSPNAARSGNATPKSGPSDPRVRQILGGLEKGGAIGNPDELPPSAIRRPPRLDMETVREQQSRGSMTSLPDLIKRATKLASNLDKGRTASRLGMLDMFNSSDPNLLNKLNDHRDQQLRDAQKRDSTISGMLSSFPAPAATPNEEHQRWGSPNDASNRELMTPLSPMNEKRRRNKDGRRCCGLPIWGFTLLLLIVIILIAAAIIIPIVLIVIPRNSSNSAPDLSNCPSTNACQNGGKSVVSNNACQCVCVGGFTGKSCSTTNDGTCTKANIGNYQGATVSKQVGSILGSGSNTFQIPLNATAILSTFSAADVSCSTEDSILTFNVQGGGNGGNARRELLVFREPQPQAITTHGIVLASGDSQPTAFPTAATLSATGTAAGSGSQPTQTPSSGSASSGPSETDENFARVVVLWAVQKTDDVNAASTVQQRLLSHLLDGSFKKGPVDAGSGIKADFTAHTISANGTTVPSS